MATASLGRPAVRSAPSLARGVAALQGLYFLVTGVWPLVSMDTFLTVTGPKTDLWLVETVGGLVAAAGAALLVAAWRGPSAEAVTLAVGSILALATVDVVYVSRRVIAPVYLLDALAEVVLLAGWVAAAWQAGGRRTAVEIPAPGLHR
jgi:hypothetical protein